MASNILQEVINSQEILNRVLDWLLRPPNQDTQSTQFECSRGEFISHFLNYIHEEAPQFDKLSETPQKVHTPKSIRRLEVSRVVKRRPALFGETEPEATTTTPKCNRLVATLNEINYSSPVSPIYSRNTFTPRAEKSGLCLGDFITQRRKSSTKKKGRNENVEPVEEKKTRRINPTNLTQRINSFGTSENSYSFTNDNEKSLSEIKFDSLKITAVAKKVNNLLSSKSGVAPDLSLVSCKGEIDRVIELYSFLLDGGFVVNVTSEMYFIFSLILSKQSSEVDEAECGGVFSTIHNTVYFAVGTLRRQLHVLGMLEKVCLRYMWTSERLKNISPDVCKEIQRIYEDKVEGLTEEDDLVEFHVCFMSDTDNRENFPSDSSFHTFRKQRDLFYEILRIWEKNRGVDDWSFGVALGGKVRSLVNLHGDPVNVRHLCRLFKSQLLTTCNKNEVEGIPEKELDFFSTIPNITSQKLNRLKNRLVTKASANGINALPTFTGNQEFYRDFITIAAMHTFNVHLKETILSDILELNDTKFTRNELEEQDNLVDDETKKSYLMCIKSLRLLAKFLGFIETLPRRQADQVVPDKIAKAEILSRLYEQPQFDLKKVLNQSIRNRSVILTIPWVTKYLAMLDYVTLRLSYYESLHEILFEILHSLNGMPFENAMLVRFCLGWLFELPHFPSEQYFIWCTQKVSKSNNSSAKGMLDDLKIVDKDVVYICCPYLNEFKKLLQHNSCTKGAATVKHITPVTASESPLQINEKRLKLQLEEAFLNGQPVSMRKTVEFVSERVASACVKHICAVVVPDFKEGCVDGFNRFVEAVSSGQDLTTKMFKLSLKTKYSDFLLERRKQLELLCLEEIDKHTSRKIASSIDLLLSDQDLKLTKEACASIARRMCRSRVQQWINSHINEGVFCKDFDAEIDRISMELQVKNLKPKSNFALPLEGRAIVHNEDAKSGGDVVNSIRELCIELLSNPTNVTTEKVVTMMNETEQSLQQRCDINNSIIIVTNKLLLDFILLLIANRFELCTPNLFSNVLTFLKAHCDDCADLFKTIISPRNIKIINSSSNPTTAWEKLAEFACAILEKNLINAQQFESQCVNIYKHEWDNGTLKNLSSCLQTVAQRGVKSDPNAAYLLSYLSEFCSSMDL